MYFLINDQLSQCDFDCYITYSVLNDSYIYEYNIRSLS